MKKRTVLFISLAIMALLSLSSCEWLKHSLGMKTSAEIEAMKLAQQEAVQQETPQQDTVSTTEQPATDQQMEFRYYVILGSFREASNVELMEKDAKKFGYNPIVIPMSNGYTMVAASGHNTLNEAAKALAQLEETDLCPYDRWIYDTVQGGRK